MCRITRFELDEALERIRPHSPLTTSVIEKYVDQLERERRHLAELLNLYEKHDDRVMDIICGKD